MANINRRLDKIIPKIKEDKFIQGRGLGNEISFYVFDYEPSEELIVREIVKEKKIFDQVFKMEEKQGKDALFKAMTTFAKPEIFLQKIKEQLGDHNIVFITGVGKVYPIVRSHNILNNLQEVIDKTPVIMFFPGKYDGQSLQLFGKFKDDNYYRAFRLVD
jgi:alanine-alpha-ketoisovalerate/valine-pyruvate aminotransferase